MAAGGIATAAGKFPREVGFPNVEERRKIDNIGTAGGLLQQPRPSGPCAAGASAFRAPRPWAGPTNTESTSMEPSKYVAFRPYCDEAIRRIDAYLKMRQEAKNIPETWEMLHLPTTPDTPPEPEEPALPTGYLDGPQPWGFACWLWPAAARDAAAVLWEAGETVEAKGISKELEVLPTYVDWERFEEQDDVTRKAAEQVKEILEAILPDAPGGHQAHAAVPGSTAAGSGVQPVTDPPEEVSRPHGNATPIREPRPEAFRAYWAEKLGCTQQKIADELGVTQGQVSKLLATVKKWAEAGNAIPEITKAKSLHSQPAAMDPAKLDLGARSDHRAANQAEKLAGIKGHAGEE